MIAISNIIISPVVSEAMGDFYEEMTAMPTNGAINSLCSIIRKAERINEKEELLTLKLFDKELVITNDRWFMR